MNYKMKILQVDKTIEADPELNDSDGPVTTPKLTICHLERRERS